MNSNGKICRGLKMAYPEQKQRNFMELHMYLRLCIYLAFVSASFFVPGPVSAAEKHDFTGEYICKGKNPDGKAYEGAVMITKKGDSFLVKWKYADKPYEGIALSTGRTLSVCWVQKQDRSIAVGIGTYTLRMGDKILDGKWTTFGGDGSVRVETLMRIEKKGK